MGRWIALQSCLLSILISWTCCYLEHVYMRPEVNSNRFEISKRFEKSFRLHDDFAAATFQTEVRFYCTCANDLGAIISDNQNKQGASYDVYGRTVWRQEKYINNNIGVATYQTSVISLGNFEKNLHCWGYWFNLILATCMRSPCVTVNVRYWLFLNNSEAKYMRTGYQL